MNSATSGANICPSPGPPNEPNPRTLLLRVETGTYVAGAVWELRNREWRCTHAAPIIAWMVGASAHRVKSWIRRSGAKYSWTEYDQA